MSITKYRALLKTIEIGNLTKAAEVLGYTQPAITHMIASMEEEYGFPLLIRDRKTVRPTENALLLLPSLEKIVAGEEETSEIVSSINKLLTGSLRIGSCFTMMSDIAVRAMAQFAQSFPEVCLQVYEIDHDELADRLKKGLLDVIMTFDSGSWEGIEFIPIWDDPICLLVRNDHPLADELYVTGNMLEGMELIAYLDGYDEAVELVRAHEQLSVKSRYTIGSDIGALKMVSLGMGAAVTYSTLEPMFPDNTSAIPFEGGYKRTLGVAFKQGSGNIPVVKEFVRVCRKL